MVTSGASDLVDVECKVLRSTERAWLVRAGSVEAWLPKSETEINDDGTVTIPEWLAVDKGLDLDARAGAAAGPGQGRLL